MAPVTRIQPRKLPAIRYMVLKYQAYGRVWTDLEVYIPKNNPTFAISTFNQMIARATELMTTTDGVDSLNVWIEDHDLEVTLL